MNILDLKRELWAQRGAQMPSNGGDGGHEGSSGGDGSGRGYGGGSGGGNDHKTGGWSGNRSERDARDNGNEAAGHQDGGDAGHPSESPNWTGTRAERDARDNGNMAAGNADGSNAGSLTPRQAADAGYGERTGMNPNNPDQTANQLVASENVQAAMGYVPKVLAMANPAFGTAMGVLNAAQSGNVGSFFGNLVGGATGLPMGAQFGAMAGNAIQTGELPSAEKVATTIGQYALGNVGALAGNAVAGALGAKVLGAAGAAAGAQFGQAVGGWASSRPDSGPSTQRNAADSVAAASSSSKSYRESRV